MNSATSLPRIPVYLLTGFLGSGKTTFLNTLLQRWEDKRVVVIENEFGSTSIDGALVSAAVNQVYELANGCICCSLDHELVEVLAQLIKPESRPDILVIEASGVADPGTVGAIFKREDVLQYFHLEKIIALADAENVADRLEETVEAGRQLVAADGIIINKCDAVHPDYLVEVQRQLARINPIASFTFARYGQVPDTFLSQEVSRERLLQQPLAEEEAHTPGLKSMVFGFRKPFDRDKLSAVLSMRLFVSYAQLYRVKGFVDIQGQAHRWLLQSTGKKLTFVDMGPWPETLPRQSALVFIGKGLERLAMQRMLDQALAE
ncbi:MAG: CobW family GTP-binding protein [Nitritalea sp.]